MRDSTGSTSQEGSAPATSTGRGRLADTDITHLALELLDEEGLDGFTMRKLASRLGVTPMAVYSHYRNKEALLEAVVDRAIGEVELPRDDEVDWQTSLEEIGHSMRAILLRHPGIVPVMLNQPTTGPHQLRLADTGYAVLRRGGLDDTAVLRAFGALVAYVMGFAALEIPRTEGPGADSIQRLQVALRGVSIEDYPVFAQLAPQMAELVSDDQFTYGLHALVSGMDTDRSRGVDL